MSKFYAEIARYYDYIFPLSTNKLNLIKDLAGNNPKDILDVASGSGLYSKQLSDDGYNVTAIDLDNEMINKLKEKDKKIDAKVLNMLDIEKLNKKFNLIFSIGNSIVHLENNEIIKKFLYSAKNSLKENGKLLIQIVNYDRILEKNIKRLPTIKNNEENLVFERYYEYLEQEHKINFKTILKVDNNTFENNVLLHPITSEEIKELLKEVGFSSINFYGDFTQSNYEPIESFPLIIVAEK